METTNFRENLPICNGASIFPEENRERKLNLLKKIKPKHRLIGDLASRGWTALMISKKLRVHYKTVMEVLKREEVIEYVNITVTDLFLESDRLLVNLYRKELPILDQELDSQSPELRDKAVDKILKCFGYRRFLVGTPSLLNQITSNPNAKGDNFIQSIEDLILQKRLTRGLPPD